MTYLCALLCKYLASVLFAFGVAVYPVRLVGGSSHHEGRVEIEYSGLWGTVCEEDWDMKDANVVCRQLGFDGAASITTSATFGEGTGHIWMDRVECVGHENALQECGFQGWAVEQCDHSRDVGVICNGSGTYSNIACVYRLL